MIKKKAKYEKKEPDFSLPLTIYNYLYEPQDAQTR